MDFLTVWIRLVPNKPDAAIEYSRLIDFDRKSLEQYAYEDEVFNVRELLSGIAPVDPIRVTDDRRSGFHIYAAEQANVQIITGNDNDTRRGRSISAPAISRPTNSPPKPI